MEVGFETAEVGEGVEMDLEIFAGRELFEVNLSMNDAFLHTRT